MPMSITFTYSGTALDVVAFMSNFPLLAIRPKAQAATRSVAPRPDQRRPRAPPSVLDIRGVRGVLDGCLRRWEACLGTAGTRRSFLGSGVTRAKSDLPT